ncbi:Triple functional domain protein [Frankliniella fusca]|uniref:Triple functional domain protein n=1 Tax=Frankliniella fusca TaxID=407009 RepID=A0AAE1HUI8_9NEOP|nr:Triple functional domain protein [Frankliniella fusca]
MSCVTLQTTVLALRQAPALKQCQDDNNNRCAPTPLASVLALKMMSSRCSLPAPARHQFAAAAAAAAGPKRCLFGAPSPADTQRLLREDQEAVRARMQRRWGWDLSREQPSTASNWQWEAVRSPARRHPYASPRTTAVTKLKTVVTPVPAMLSPLPATPTALDSSTSSSSSGTSTMPASPSSPGSPLLSSLPVPAASCESEPESEDSCCGDSDCSTSSETGPRPAPVQTRLTGRNNLALFCSFEIGGNLSDQLISLRCALFLADEAVFDERGRPQGCGGRRHARVAEDLLRVIRDGNGTASTLMVVSMTTVLVVIPSCETRYRLPMPQLVRSCASACAPPSRPVAGLSSQASCRPVAARGPELANTASFVALGLRFQTLRLASCCL